LGILSQNRSIETNFEKVLSFTGRPECAENLHKRRGGRERYLGSLTKGDEKNRIHLLKGKEKVRIRRGEENPDGHSPS